MIPGKTLRNGGRAVLSSILLTAGCLRSPTGPTTSPTNGTGIGNGELEIYSVFSAAAPEEQKRHGKPQFNIRAEDGVYRVEGGGGVSFEETVKGTNCNWTARTGGWATLGGRLSDCQLLFDVTIVWETPVHMEDVHCVGGVKPQVPPLQTERFILGPMPLVNGFPFPKIVTDRDGKWIGSYESTLRSLFVRSSTGCTVTTHTP